MNNKENSFNNFELSLDKAKKLVAMLVINERKKHVKLTGLFWDIAQKRSLTDAEIKTYEDSLSSLKKIEDIALKIFSDSSKTDKLIKDIPDDIIGKLLVVKSLLERSNN